MNKETIIYSPVEGKIKSLSKVNDDMFSSLKIGNGVSIIPKTSKNVTVFSVMNKGKIKTIANTSHSFIQNKGKIDILVHLGIDSVSLKGQGFKTLISENKKASLNEEIIEFDTKFLKDKKIDTDVIVLLPIELCNKYNVEILAADKVKIGEPLLRITKLY